MFIDSHAHLTSDSLFSNLESILARAVAVGVEAVVNICTDLVTLQRGLDIACRYSWIFNAAAIPPHDIQKEESAMFSSIERGAYQGHLVAIGETGLDYFYHGHSKELQKSSLRRHLALALECRLPVVIHCREAFADLFEILDRHYCPGGNHACGVLHCFTGTEEEAKEILRRNWYVSFSGIVTFKRSDPLRELARFVPLDRLLIETDAPYLSPQTRRGIPNEPAFILETAEVLAAIHGISLEELGKITSANARKLFGLIPNENLSH